MSAVEDQITRAERLAGAINPDNNALPGYLAHNLLAGLTDQELAIGLMARCQKPFFSSQQAIEELARSVDAKHGIVRSTA